MIDATANEHELIKSLVLQLEEAAPDGDRPQMQLYPLPKTLDATVIATLKSLAPDAEVSPSTDGKQLVVVARPADQDTVKEMLDHLSAAVVARPELQTYPLTEPLDATVLATMKTLVPDAQVSTSADGKQLIVVADADDHALVQTHLEQLQAVAAKVEKRALKIYPLQKTPDASVITTLSSLVPTATISVSTDAKRLNRCGQPHGPVDD